MLTKLKFAIKLKAIIDELYPIAAWLYYFGIVFMIGSAGVGTIKAI